MTIKSKWISIALLCLSVQASAMILPPNNLKAKDSVRKRANLTEAQFNEIIGGIIKIYAPIAKSHGANLVGIGAWDDPMVNAYADQSGINWSVHMFGGLARRDEITPDGFALVMCHEIGHHLGGYAYYDGNGDWAAVEGQADYFATHVCGKKVLAAPFMAKYDDHEAPPKIVTKLCKKAWHHAEDRNVCFREAKASQSLANLLALVTTSADIFGNAAPPPPKPSFDVHDETVVETTFPGHPPAQCRLDTYLSASLCRAKFDDRIIPGKGFAAGNNSKDAEFDAARYTCVASQGAKVGNRPLCWFKPQL